MKKIEYSTVKKVFEDNGATLISKKYNNSKEKLEFICKCSNKDKKSFKEFKKYPFCSKCSSNRKLTYEEVSDYFSNNNCILLSDNYINNRQKLRYICSCGNESIITYDHFSQGHRCKKCGYKKCGDKQRYKYDEVFTYFKDNNCILLSTEYMNNRTPLDFICECGNESTTTFDSFKRGCRCKTCGIKKNTESRRRSYDTVKTIFESKGCKLLSNEYINNHTQLHYICSCGNENWITLSDFMNNHDCRECGNLKISIFNKTEREYIRGEDHPNWDHSIPQEEREKNRWLTEQKIWRKDVYERDCYTCQCCGDNSGGNLQAHHLDGYDWCEGSRWDIDNGITLCEDCHKNFHIIYGYGLNTKEQFDEYMEGISWPFTPFYNIVI